MIVGNLRELIREEYFKRYGIKLKDVQANDWCLCFMMALEDDHKEHQLYCAFMNRDPEVLKKTFGNRFKIYYNVYEILRDRGEL